MKLFFVAHSTDSESYDLFVVADTVEQAQAVWRDYFPVKADAVPESIFKVAAASPVGLHEDPHALNWHGMHLPRVGGSLPANPRD